MRVIIAGCGRVGAQLASAMDEQGHHVTVIDRDPDAFRRLGEDYGGERVSGVVFDRGTLQQAGIDEVDAFVAVTSGDNSNIVSARVASERFGVKQVVARIYDPDRATIYERHGITTIATVRWTSDAILSYLAGATEWVEGALGPGDGDVVVLCHELAEDAESVPLDELRAEGRWLPVAVTRAGQTTVVQTREVLQGGDQVHLAVQRTAADDARDFLAELDARS